MSLLNLHRRGLLFCLWLEYAASPHGKPLDALGLPADVRRLNRYISASARQSDVDELVDRGWLFYSDFERLGDALEDPAFDAALTQNVRSATR